MFAAGFRLAVGVAIAVEATGGHAQPRVFRCVDAKGNVTYTQTGCDPRSAQRRLDERLPAPVAPIVEERASEHSRLRGPDATDGAVASQPIDPAQAPARRWTPIRRQVEAPGAGDPDAPTPTTGIGSASTELEAPDRGGRRLPGR